MKCFCIFSSSYITRVFIKTEMLLKSKSVCSGSKQLVRSRSSDNLPTSQSQVNIQMMSHTLTIREVGKQSATKIQTGRRRRSEFDQLFLFFSSLSTSNYFSRLLGVAFGLFCS